MIMPPENPSPGCYWFVVPSDDGCKALPAGSRLYVDSRDECREEHSVHILENNKTGERIARWIYPADAGQILTCKYDGGYGDRVAVMMIDIDNQDCEWKMAGCATHSISGF